MAKSATQGRAKRAREQETQLRQLVVLDFAKGWTIPLVAIIVALLTWPASVAGLIDTSLALGIAVAALMVAALHAGLCDFADPRTTRSTTAALAAFAALWAFVVYSPFEAKMTTGRELFAAQLPLHGEPVTVPLHSEAGDYRLFVEGNLGTSTDHANRAAEYRIGVAGEGVATTAIAGEFSDRWSQRRSGRRGVSTVHTSRTEQEHRLSSATGADVRLSLDSLSPGAHDAVGIHLFRERFPTSLFVVLGTALTAAAVVIDTWRFVDPQELLLTTITLGALLGVASFRRFAPPHPGFGDLAFNGAVGAIAGTIGGRLLARVGHVLRARRQAARAH